MNSITIIVDENTLKKMNYFYNDHFIQNNNAHALFIAKTDNCTITAYKSKKVLFQGKDAESEASIWQEIKQDQVSIDNVSSDYYVESIGSDEVGTGDYFGPVVVVSAYLSPNATEQIKKLNIDDSKKLNDDDIIKVAPTLFKLCPYSLLIVNNEKYNEVMDDPSMNLNKLKAILHKQAITNLIKKINKKPQIIIDQFSSIENFNKYVSDTSFSKQVNFQTKAESKFASVACASMMARYIFLEEMDKLSNKLKTPLQRGASNLVDQQGKALVKEHGVEILKQIAKYHFANTNKILKNK